MCRGRPKIGQLPKQEFVECSPMLFENSASSDVRDERIAELERMAGRLATELEMH